MIAGPVGLLSRIEVRHLVIRGRLREAMRFNVLHHHLKVVS